MGKVELSKGEEVQLNRDEWSGRELALGDNNKPAEPKITALAKEVVVFPLCGICHLGLSPSAAHPGLRYEEGWCKY